MDALPFHLSLLVHKGMAPDRLALLARAHQTGMLSGPSTQPDGEMPYDRACFVTRLLREGGETEVHYYRLAAERLGLSFTPAPDVSALLPMPKDCPLDGLDAFRWILARPFSTMAGIPPRPDAHLIAAPRPDQLDQLKERLEREPELRQRLSLTTPSALRSVHYRLLSGRAMAEQVFRLKAQSPALSAHKPLARWLSILVLALLPLFLITPFFVPLLALGLNLLAVGLFVSIAALRIFAARRFGAIRTNEAGKLAAMHMAQEAMDRWPRYGVLVPLFREAAIVPDLIASLKALDYPRDRLQIYLIVEADDAETKAALGQHALPGFMDMIEVPAEGPRTKPKALNFALSFVDAEFLVIYDAEDRPHPNQLKEAALRMASGPDTLACLQGRLAIDNRAGSWLSRQFAIEYAALFDGLLPYLSHEGLPIPLGGTSNHFRTTHLRAVGGWDPFNVTEDADLGIRLYRKGYEIGVLLTDTQEEAPERFGAWTRQRSRWFKGWMQTWLVHMRQPRALYKAMGRPGFFTFQILIGGMLISALIHPLYLITFSLSLAALLQGHVTAGFWLMLMINCLNLIVGYGGAMALGHRAAHARCGTGWRAIAMMPLYWLVMTPAAWRALYQLLFDPHHWEKTEHGLSDDRPQVCGKI